MAACAAPAVLVRIEGLVFEDESSFRGQLQPVIGVNTYSIIEGSDPGGVGYESIVSERVRWQLRSLMHHNECCNAENS